MKSANLYAEDYYNWLLGFIEDDEHCLGDYENLLNTLFNFEFYEIVKNDCNRVADGLNLRNKFSESIGEHLYFVDEDLPPYCSVLEMMIALAIRLEVNLMYDPDKGDRTALWFWIMIQNLGLEDETNEFFDEQKCLYILQNFVDRKYEKDGHFGLFKVGKKWAEKWADMRKIEIWYQANYFFTENYEKFK